MPIDDKRLIAQGEPLRPSVTLSVSQLVARVRGAIERELPLSWVRGEISGFRRAASGHCYFALKDESAQVSCVLYRHKLARIPIQLRDGLAVELRVLATMYTPRGEFQLQVEEARLSGVGALYEAYLRLKARLEAEGLFDVARKRPLPRFPKTVGLITSAHAAVLHDMVRSLRERWPAIDIVLYPALVQGEGAPASLIAALAKANARKDADVLIIGRGGGSLDDLWAFNDEALVRAIAASALPIVSAVGHETDFTLADFAADARASTPTYAATLVVPAVHEWMQRIDRAVDALRALVRHSVQRRADQLATLRARLKHPRDRLRLQQAQLRALHQRWRAAGQSIVDRHALPVLATRLRAAQFHVAQAKMYLRRNGQLLQRAAHAHLAQQQSRLNALAQALTHLSPERVLARGYAVVQAADGTVVSSVQRVVPRSKLSVRFVDGTVLTTVDEVRRS